jgi:transcriptional regulator with XRE-family HTH domain
LPKRAIRGPERSRLAEALKAARERTGLSGNRFAQQIGWLQSRVSKLETGDQFPSEEDVRAWGAAAGAPPEVLQDQLSQLERARAEYATWTAHFRAAGGPAGKQSEIGRRYASAARVAKFQPVMIPSQVQTAEYARELLHSPSGPLAFGASGEEIDAMVAARMERQQLLYEPGRKIEVVILEAALRVRLVSPAAQAGQLDRLIALDGLPALDLGVIPASVLVPVFPLSGFVLFDDQLVVIETITGEQQLSDPAEIARYAEWFDLLHKSAVRGRDAAQLIRSAMSALQDPPGS